MVIFHCYVSSPEGNQALDDLKRLRFNATSHGADAAGGWPRPVLGYLTETFGCCVFFF